MVRSQACVSGLLYCGKTVLTPASNSEPGARLALKSMRSSGRSHEAMRPKMNSGSKFGSIPKRVKKRPAPEGNNESMTAERSETSVRSAAIGWTVRFGTWASAASREINTSGTLTSSGR